MYSLFCVTEAEYVMRFRYSTMPVRNTPEYRKEVHSFIVPPRLLEKETTTTEVAIFESQKELVFFIKNWFDSRNGFFCCDDINSVVKDRFSNPESFLGLPFEAFEIHNNGVAEKMLVRDLYYWRH